MVRAHKMRILLFVILLIVSTSMTFIQFGFVGLVLGDSFAAYFLALLCPVSVAALLLGWKIGALMGLFLRDNPPRTLSPYAARSRRAVSYLPYKLGIPICGCRICARPSL